MNKLITHKTLGAEWAVIAKQLLAKKQLLGPVKLKMMVPGGFDFDAFNGRGFIKPCHLLTMFDWTASAFHLPFEDGSAFMESTKVLEDYRFFAASAKTTCTPQLYDPSIPKGPLEIDLEAVQLGTASFNLEASMFLEGITSPVATTSFQLVVMDRKTLMPAPVPSWWVNKFKEHIPDNTAPLQVDRLFDTKDVPPVYKDYCVTVPSRDVGSQMYAFWRALSKYCYEAFVEHQVKTLGGMDKEIKVEDVMRIPKSISQMFRAPLFMGDKVNVYVWQKEGDENVFQFDLLKGSKVVGECGIEFYPEAK